jgi:microcin C transport system substrate-binding protein
LNNTTSFERIVNPFIKNLKRLGVDATFRVVDGAQYQARLNEFDFDIASRRFAFSATLSDPIREYWTTRSASVPGSSNLAGISDPVIDALTDKVLAAQSKEEMVTAARAIDRVLRAGYYWIPQWYKNTHSVAIWDMFGFPPEPPKYFFPVEDLWWIDPEKAKIIEDAG